MSGPNLISPLLDGFIMGAPISSHHGVRCCPAMKRESDSKYIVKIISIPASQVQLDALLLTGAYKDAAEAMDYFKALADSVTKEIDFLLKLSKIEGFLPYEGYQVVPMEDNQLGYHIYMVGSYKRSLERHIRRNSITHSDAINLALNLCSALSACRRAGSIYVALKPENVYLSEDKEYRIGDLGFIELESLKYMPLPDKYKSPYSPPEAMDPMQTLNETIDTYALGMILYQIYNNGKLPSLNKDPSERYPAPSNASGEIADIIAKAIAPNFEDRYKDPAEMGRALVSCLQNSAGEDTIIKGSSQACSSKSASSDTQVFSSSAITAAQAAQENPTSSADTRVLPAEQIRTAVSGDTRVVASAEIRAATCGDTKVIPTVSETEDTPGTANLIETEPLRKNSSLSHAPTGSSSSAETKVIPTELVNEAHIVSPASPEDEEEEYESDDDDVSPIVPLSKKKKGFFWKSILLPILILILVAGLCYGGYYYYQNTYLQRIDNMFISGNYNSFTVNVDTTIDESLLSIVCTDTYGNTVTQKLDNGKTEFTDLLPSSQYKINLEIEGFHQLIGKTSDVYNTEAKTEIISFTGITGAEDGSVLLTFAVDGPEPDEWIITYTAEGEEAKTVSFTGHNVTIKGLVVPKEYTFTLSPNREMYVTGDTTLSFTASSLVMAQNLAITACTGGELAVRWDVPEGAVVDNWTVRCYSDDGYEQVLETADSQAVFSGIDPSRPYHVEVTASGMTQAIRTSITANPLTITALNVNEEDPYLLTVTWDYEGEEPSGGWLLMYSLDGSNTQSVVKCENSTAVISPRIHGATYKFIIQAADSTSIFDNTHIYNCPNAEIYRDHSFDPDKVIAYLTVTPEKENWTSADVSKDKYSDQFRVGEKISVILYCPIRFYIPKDDISILYVIRNGEGNVVTKLISQATDDWHDMWVHYNTSYAELDIPTVPTELGNYSISIYFNGKAITSTTFSIIE